MTVQKLSQRQLQAGVIGSEDLPIHVTRCIHNAKFDTLYTSPF